MAGASRVRIVRLLDAGAGGGFAVGAGGGGRSFRESDGERRGNCPKIRTAAR